MSCASHKVGDATQSKKCSICDRYLRKIEEIEQVLSGRESIVQALQGQLKKCETNYKSLFNDFEQLRFEHSTALQDNFSLKKINAKLEEFTIEKQPTKTDERQQKEQQSTSPFTLSDIRINEAPKDPILQEVNTIEKLVINQNQTLKELINRIIEELNINNCGNIYQDTRLGDTDPKFQKLTEGIDKLKILVNEYQTENDRMRKLLVQKTSEIKSNKTSKEASQIPNMSEHNCCNEMISTKTDIDETKTSYDSCTCTLIEQLEDMNHNNEVLSDTLKVITSENKNNLEIINNLKSEIKRLNDECEANRCRYQCRLSSLENTVEEKNRKEQKLQETIKESATEVRTLKEKLKIIQEEKIDLGSCSQAINCVDIEAENKQLKKELSEKSLEIAEYEEDNRSLCQKIDALATYNNQLIIKIKNLEEELEEIKDVKTNDVVNQLPSDSHLENKECTNEKCKLLRVAREDQSYEVESLTKSLKMNMCELERLGQENKKLTNELQQLKQQNKAETERLQALVDQSQKQVELLVREHDEKTSQIESVAVELDNIRKSVTEDADSCAGKIKQLEKERDDLKKVIADHNQCTCSNLSQEVPLLKSELIKKQCIIAELEQSVDSFNKTLKNFDKTVDELACQNQCLQKDRESILQQIADLQAKLAEKSKEVETLKDELATAQLRSEKAERNSSTLDDELQQFKNKGSLNQDKLRSLELENDALKDEIDKLKAEKMKLEMASMENYQVQIELDHLKENQSKRESTMSNKMNELNTAYDELKSKYNALNKENEALKQEVEKQKESEKPSDSMKTANECLRKRASLMTHEIDTLKAECDRLKIHCAMKCVEMDYIKEEAKQRTSNAQELQDKLELLEKNKQDQARKESAVFGKLNDLQNAYDELKRLYDQVNLENEDIKREIKKCNCKGLETCAENLKEENKKLKTQSDLMTNEIENLKNECDKYKRQCAMRCIELNCEREEKRQRDNDCQAIKEKLRKLEDERQEKLKQESAAADKLNDLQNAYNELKRLYDQAKEKNAETKRDLKNCTCKEDALEMEKQKLGVRTGMMNQEVEALRIECDRLKRQCAIKCVELECLKEAMTEEKIRSDSCSEGLKDKLVQYQRLYEQRERELKKCKKQSESCAKQSQITREEYNNLRKEYKEIKTMMSEQIKKYRQDTGSTMEPVQACHIMKSLKKQLQSKETEVIALQKKMKDASHEIIELKDYIHKLICDNNVLKNAINSLIGNLERKIKGPSFGSLPHNSAEALAGEIMNSLTTIEDIMKKNDCCSKDCGKRNNDGSLCDCLSEITYHFKESQQELSRKKSTGTITCVPFATSTPTKALSDTTTNTDTDDFNCTSFMDKTSMDFFKNATSDVREQTRKGNCCNIESFSRS